MILKKISLENFRQFKGMQEIEFSTSTPSITIIYGENGRGKTGLFRALIFCLFGGRKLPQDEDTQEKDINLVNTQSLEEFEGKPVIAKVAVQIMHGKNTYLIERSIKGLKDGDEIIEQLSSVSLQVTDEIGNTKPPVTDKVEVSEIIASFFDPKIKDYFLFDGEKIEKLTKADSVQKKTVSQGIKNLLNINDLEYAIKGVKLLREQLRCELDRHSDGELTKVLKAIEANRSEVESKISQKDGIVDQLVKAEKEKNVYDGQLDNIKEIKALIEKRKRLLTDKEDRELQQENLTTQMRRYMLPISMSLLEPILKDVYEVLDEKKKIGEIPIKSKLDLIEKILQDHECICGEEICENSKKYQKIIEWRDAVQESGINNDNALDLWKDTDNILQNIDDTVLNSQKALQESDKMSHAIKDINEDLHKISKQINDSDAEKAKRYNESRDKVIRDIGSYKNQIDILDEAVDNLQSRSSELSLIKDKLQQKEGVKNELDSRASLAIDTHSALQDIYDSFTKDIKQQLSKLASASMEQIMDEEGKRSLKRIVVKDDYSLQVHDHRDKQFLANISAGQRQIVSICFITALAQLATGHNSFEIPLFMDTPFGRLSFDHRVNLINFIPKICKQWVAMVTDTELTDREWNAFRKTSENCVFYMLKSTSEGASTIEPIPMNDALQIITQKDAL